MSSPIEQVATEAVVCPYRFSPNPAAMIDFYQLLGLRLWRRQRDFAILQGRSGRVAVHPLVTSGQERLVTSLVLEVPDATVAAERLTAAGLDATWWDESWGRQAAVSGPSGRLSLNAESDDAYGYQVDDQRGSEVDVVSTLFTDAFDAEMAFWARLGFAPGVEATPHWTPLRAAVDAGIVGLHDGGAETAPDGGVTTQIGLETTESLDALIARLESSGVRVAVVTESGPEHLLLTDPDGEPLEVYHREE